MICTNNREKTCFTIVVKILYTNSYKRICFTILYCTLVQILCTSNCKMICCYELNKFSVQTTRKGLFYSTVHTFGTNKRKTFFLGTWMYILYVQKTGTGFVVLYCSKNRKCIKKLTFLSLTRIKKTMESDILSFK